MSEVAVTGSKLVAGRRRREGPIEQWGNANSG